MNKDGIYDSGGPLRYYEDRGNFSSKVEAGWVRTAQKLEGYLQNKLERGYAKEAAKAWRMAGDAAVRAGNNKQAVKYYQLSAGNYAASYLIKPNEEDEKRLLGVYKKIDRINRGQSEEYHIKKWLYAQKAKSSSFQGEKNENLARLRIHKKGLPDLLLDMELNGNKGERERELEDYELDGRYNGNR